ncbi:tryptophan halogenase family protein [Pseudoteredinibacter isoporae]|uniref:tryptophan halogenase family protein n=1 Tax=Pseudoteredinibacter isoporae TaxID=570281 RepID=UPI00310B7EA1
MNQPLKFVIVGGGSAGWMCASLLQQHFSECTVVLLESESRGIIGVGEGSTPSLKRFFEAINISESEWMPQCNATYKCGIRFPGWLADAQKSYFHPFYSQADHSCALKFFRNCQLRRAGWDMPSHPDAFFISSEIARLGLSPKSEHEAFSLFDYGYHFDAHLLAEFLASVCIARGVEHRKLDVERVNCSADGYIHSLIGECGAEISGDIFFDASGFRRLLCVDAQKTDFLDYSNHLVNNAAVAMPCPLPSDQDIPSETLSEAMPYGWRWQIPLQNRIGNGYVFNRDYLSHDEASLELCKAIHVDPKSSTPLKLNWTPGRLKTNWTQNCVAIGLSQGFLEPLEAAMLHTIQDTIESFIDCFTQADFSHHLQGQHNQRVNDLIDGTRDYIQAHYLLNTRQDTQYWKDAREQMDVSSDLGALIDGWMQKHSKDPDALEAAMQGHRRRQVYRRTSWYCLFSGMEHFPDARRIPNGDLEDYGYKLKQMRDVGLDTFVSHRAALARHRR